MGQNVWGLVKLIFEKEKKMVNLPRLLQSIRILGKM